MRNLLMSMGAVAFLVMPSTMAAEFKPAVAYDPAGKLDKSFNQAVYTNGVKKFIVDSGIHVKEYAPSGDAERERGLESLAKRGYSPIVVVGFSYAASLANVAKDYPDIDFAIIDSVVDLPNVKSLLFAEHEGSFLVGALAAMNASNNTIGFIGGMDIPFIRKFECGYVQGARYVNPQINVLSDMAGDTPEAFANPAKGTELAKAQINKGAEVIFAAAGGTGHGVYIAANEHGKLAIGVDSNQNDLQPGTMLTSMVKRVGYTTYQLFEQYQRGTFVAGIETHGLADHGVTWALDKYNRKLVSAEQEAKIRTITQKVIDGEIVVHDFTQNNSCTAIANFSVPQTEGM